MAVINPDTLIQNAEDVQRPFLGLRSFQEKNKDNYGGRDVEITDLYKLVMANALTIIFGKSGIGKTSLINAGLIPILQKNYCLVINLRIDYASSESPLIQLKKAIYEKIKSVDAAAPEIGNHTLWQYFHEVKLLNGLITPVLILDQFEELFTLANEKERDTIEMIIELADLVENRVPLELQKSMQDNPAMMTMQYTQPAFRLIFSLREDYLAQLESLKYYMPSIKNSRYRVMQMTAVQALDAVTKPGKDLLDNDIAREIIKKLPGVTDKDFDPIVETDLSTRRMVVEPFLLSLICFQINETRLQQKLDKITFELVSQFNVSNVIEKFYDENVAALPDNVRFALEDNLLTESGYRKLQAVEELHNEHGIDDAIIERLVNNRIIRKEQREGVEYVELIHDVLAPVIRECRGLRQQAMLEKEKAETLRLAEEENLKKLKQADEENNRKLKAAEEENTKRRKKILTIFAVICLLGLTALSITWYFFNKNRAEAKRLQYLEMAPKILVSAISARNNWGDDTSAALLSLAAYNIYKENKGESFNSFYSSMRESLGFLGVDFQTVPAKNNHPISAIRGIAVKDGQIYYAYASGIICRKNATNPADSNNVINTIKVDTRTNLPVKITNMAFSNEGNYLAVAGNFGWVQVDNLLMHDKAGILLGDELKFLNNNINGKSVHYDDRNNLFVRTDSAIAGWQVDFKSNKSITWPARKTYIFEDGKIRPENFRIKWGLNYFRIPGKQFNSMDILGDHIILGTNDSSILLLTPDSLVEMKHRDFGLVTSVALDRKGNYTFVGNSNGALFRLRWNGDSLVVNQNQTARIWAIKSSKDGKTVATASSDGTLAIIENSDRWADIDPLVLSLNRCEINPAFTLCFSPDDSSVFVGYADGSVSNWQVHPEQLAALIRQRIGEELDIEKWKMYVPKDLSRKYFGEPIMPEILKELYNPQENKSRSN